jgi:hypothetical protein
MSTVLNFSNLFISAQKTEITGPRHFLQLRKFEKNQKQQLQREEKDSESNTAALRITTLQTDLC